MADLERRANLQLLQMYNRQLASRRTPPKQAGRIARNRAILIRILRDRGDLPNEAVVEIR